MCLKLKTQIKVDNMRYNFDKMTDRRDSNSLKWNVGKKELSMGIADMDFKTAQCIIDAVVDKAKQGIYGYGIVPDEWYTAIIDWWQRRHNLTIKKEWLMFSNGVVPTITSAIKRITNVGDNIVILTPVYDIFFNSIENTGRHALECQLKYENGIYTIDFDDLEKKLSNKLSTMLILCNPHNPIGKIWSKFELEKIALLSKKYGVVVLSDEVHCDITIKNYIPFISSSEYAKNNCIVCMSAGKCFNLAGMQSAIVCMPSDNLRNKIERGINSDDIAEPNSFAIESVVSAFNRGEEWLNKVNQYIFDNIKFAKDYIAKNMPFLTVVNQDATYLIWIDCSFVTSDTEELCNYIRNNTGLYINSGLKYRGNGKYFVRMNLATQRIRVEKGLNLFFDGIKNYMLEHNIEWKK